MNPHENRLSSVVVTALRDIICHDPPPPASLDGKSRMSMCIMCQPIQRVPLRLKNTHAAVFPPIFQHWRRIASKQGLWYTKVSAVINRGLRPTAFVKKGSKIDQNPNEKSTIHSATVSSFIDPHATQITFFSGVLWFEKGTKTMRIPGHVV